MMDSRSRGTYVPVATINRPSDRDNKSLGEMTTRIEKTPVDSGYSWIIVSVCVIHVMFVIGGIKSFGIFYTEMLEYFGAGAGNTAWIGGLAYVFMFFLGPFAAHLVEAVSFRTVMFIGGILCFVGYVLSAFVNHMEIMYLTYGVIAGVGYGLIYPPSMTIISFYFVKHRALANGLASAGSGIGGFLFPYIYRGLIDQFMLSGALMITGAIFLHMCITSLLLRQPMQLVKKKLMEQRKNVEGVDGINDIDLTKSKADNQTGHTETGHHSSAALNKKCKSCDVIDWSLFKNFTYVIYAISLVIQTTGDLAVFIVFPAHITALGFSKQKVAIAFSLTGISEVVFRTFIGWLADREIFKVKNILLFTIVMNGVTAVLIPLFKNYEAYVVYAVIMGAFPGTFWGLLPVLLTECLGLQRLPKAYGFILLLSPISALGQPIAGWIADFSGNWDHSFRYAAGCNFLAAVVLLMEPVYAHFCKRKELQVKET